MATPSRPERTCQSFYSVSTEPPLVSFSVMTNSTTYPRVRETGRFAVNVLAQDQHTVSNQFARKGTDKWAGIDWTPTEAGNPVIADTLMWLDCDIWAEHEAGSPAAIAHAYRDLSTDFDWDAYLDRFVEFLQENVR